MLGFVVVNAFFAHRYFNDALADFKAEMDRLALKLMTNPDAEPAHASPNASAARATWSPSPDVHELVPLRSVLGDKWKPGMQERCMICDSHTAWVCRQCSVGASSLVPLCPEYTKPKTGAKKGQKIFHMCCGKHALSPDFFPKGRTKTQTKRKRANGEACEACDE